MSDIIVENIPDTPFIELVSGSRTFNIDMRTVCNLTYKQGKIWNYGKIIRFRIRTYSWVEVMFDNGTIIKGGLDMEPSDYEVIKKYWMNVRSRS